jgi:NIMA (never in mitosis gene a)-related kinase
VIWSLFIQVVEGLKQLHTLGIFHRDIKVLFCIIVKPANIFLNDGDIAKLGDMNVSKISESGLCMTQTGTPYYASP